MASPQIKRLTQIKNPFKSFNLWQQKHLTFSENGDYFTDLLVKSLKIRFKAPFIKLFEFL